MKPQSRQVLDLLRYYGDLGLLTESEARLMDGNR